MLRPYAFLAFLVAAAPAGPSPAPRSATCHPQGTTVSTDLLRDGGFRRLSATLSMAADPTGQAPPIMALELASAGTARRLRLIGKHSGPKSADTPWTRLMTFQLEEVDSEAVVLKHSNPAYVYLDPDMKIDVETGPNGAYSFRVRSPDSKGRETEQSGALSVEPMPQAKLVLLCLGADFELKDLRIE